jgi:hypothetical protein
MMQQQLSPLFVGQAPGDEVESLKDYFVNADLDI